MLRVAARARDALGDVEERTDVERAEQLARRLGVQAGDRARVVGDDAQRCRGEAGGREQPFGVLGLAGVTGIADQRVADAQVRDRAHARGLLQRPEPVTQMGQPFEVATGEEDDRGRRLDDRHDGCAGGEPSTVGEHVVVMRAESGRDVGPRGAETVNLGR